MTAGVVEGSNLAVVAPHDDDGLAGALPHFVAPGLRELVEVAGEEPGPTPQALTLELEEAAVGVAPTRQIRESGKALRRALALRFVPDALSNVRRVLPGVHLDGPYPTASRYARIASMC